MRHMRCPVSGPSPTHSLEVLGGVGGVGGSAGGCGGGAGGGTGAGGGGGGGGARGGGSASSRLRMAAWSVSTFDSACAMAEEMAQMWCRKKEVGEARDVP